MAIEAESKLIIEDGQEIIDAFDKIGAYVNNEIGPAFLKGAAIIVVLFATVRIGISALNMITNPERENSWFNVLFKPVLLMLFILFYGGIMMFVDKSLGLTNRIIPGDPLLELNKYLHRKATEVVYEEVSETKIINGGGLMQQNGTTTRIVAVEPDLDSEEQKMINSIMKRVEKDNDFKAADNKNLRGNVLTKGFQKLMMWLGTVIRTIMMGLRQLLLTILLVGGPLAILLSFVPTLENSAAQWFGMYIHTFMWLPVSKIIDYFVLVTSKALLLSDKEGMIFFLLECVLVIAYLYLPKITSFFVSSKDGGGIMSTMGMAAFGAFKQVSSKIAAAKPGFATIAGNIEKGVGIAERISNLRTGGSNNGANTDKLT